ncbi:MAG: endo-1,4-beta-xylanase, partial [Moorea sp. SIO3C2]|nr:endo-1,4-beta-xylanase [Moorena sp. SIO3C2]
MLAFTMVVLVAAALTAVWTPARGADDDGVAAAARSGLHIGGAMSGYDAAWPDDPLLEIAVEHFSAVTAAAYMPWGAWPDPDQPVQTAGFDDVVAWASEHDLLVHGHTLVYPSQNARLDWWVELEDGHEALLQHFVTQMAASNAGDVWVWDVVNEVMAPDGSPADPWGLRRDVIEHEKIGPNYVDLAFRWARAADPDALLILNDYGAEERNPKSDRLFAYVQELRRRGVPIDGVGFQFHVNAVEGELDWESVRSNLERFADAGFRVFITELDVPVVALAADEEPTSGDLERQRAVFEEVARIATELDLVDSLLMWNYVDERSWLHPARNTLSENVVAGVYTHPT